MADEIDPDRMSIRLDGVSKRYHRKHLDGMLLKELLPGGENRLGEDDPFWALREIDLDVSAGETLAVLGKNGSGKSTLLGLLAGAIRPTEGQVSVRGRIAPMLALGVGFEADMNGIENAYLTASLLGVSPDEVTAVLQEIIAFAELGAFIDTPVRHYSSGMLARLGFAVAMHIEREVLLVDEVLAVGDHTFQQKCLSRIRELQSLGVTLVFVTHDAETARKVCDRAIWLEQGRIRLDAPVEETLREYEKSS